MTFKRNKMNSRIILSLLIGFLFFSCSEEETTPNNTTQNNQKELFQELFFGNNPNTKLSHVKDLSTMKSGLKSDQLAEVNRIEKVILDNIETIDEDFFSRFNKGITSGNHLTIQKTLADGGQILEKGLLNTSEIAEEVMLGKELADKIDINDFKKPNGELDSVALNDYISKNYPEFVICGPTFCVAAVYLAVAVSVAAAVNYAGAVNVYIWFNAFRWTNGPSRQLDQSLTESKLQEEMLIDEIARLYNQK